MFYNRNFTKPFMYSVEVYLSLRINEFVAISVNAITATQLPNQPKMKPYGTGDSPDKAIAKLASSITGITGRKDLGIINIRNFHKYVCVDCNQVTSFETKAQLVEHRQFRHHTSAESPYIQSGSEALKLP